MDDDDDDDEEEGAVDAHGRKRSMEPATSMGGPGEGRAKRGKVPMDITDPVLQAAYVRAMSVRMVPPVPLLDSDDEEQSDGEGGILMNMSEPRDRMADVYIAAAKIDDTLDAGDYSRGVPNIFNGLMETYEDTLG